MPADVQAFIESWKKAVEGEDLAAILAHFAPQMTFTSPILYKPSNDRAYIDRVITIVAETLGDFRYTEVYTKPGGAALVFKARVGSLEIEGIDLFELNDQGQVRGLKVMVRPLTAAIALGQAVREQYVTLAKDETI